MKSVLITGCSSGFGLYTAVELAKDGWQVIATMRDPARRDRLDEAVKDAGVTLGVVALDVCSPSSIESGVAEALAITGGTLDAVVHNAGIGDGGYFEDFPEDTARRMMETNVFGVFALTRAVLPVMRARSAGRIVAVSSISAFAGPPGFSVYAASKWALEGWAESLACEVAPFGIDVCLVEPGAHRTDIWTNAHLAGRPGSPYQRYQEVLEPRVRAMNERFGGDPRDVARRVSSVLAARHPRFRNPVGSDAWASRIVGHLLPFGVRRRLFLAMAGTGRIRP